LTASLSLHCAMHILCFKSCSQSSWHECTHTYTSLAHRGRAFLGAGRGLSRDIQQWLLAASRSHTLKAPNKSIRLSAHGLNVGLAKRSLPHPCASPLNLRHTCMGTLRGESMCLKQCLQLSTTSDDLTEPQARRPHQRHRKALGGWHGRGAGEAHLARDGLCGLLVLTRGFRT
jgi:hypothetical protein